MEREEKKSNLQLSDKIPDENYGNKNKIIRYFVYR
jgi:hypothetical protein